MQFTTFLLVYGCAFAAFLFVMLFGELAMFAGTPISTVHYCLSNGPCDAAHWLAVAVGGERGERMSDRCNMALCESKTPWLQAVYLAMVAGGYHLYFNNVFAMLPLPGVPLWHMYTGTATVALVLAAFMAASFTDPGLVTPASLPAYLATPYDGLTNRPKTCSTCHLQRPARAKHCNICGGCVARFDHHCGWVNNCIGANNLRWFLAFLLGNLVMAVYGVALIWWVLKEELTGQGVWRYRFMDSSGSSRTLGESPTVLLEWLVVHYGTQVLLGVLFVALAALMASFVGYHLWLVSRGVTTYETYKWRDVRRAGGRAPWEAYQDGEFGAVEGKSSSEVAAVWWRSLLPPWHRREAPKERHRPTATAGVMPPNIYRQSLAASFGEILFPHSSLRQQRFWRANQGAHDRSCCTSGDCTENYGPEQAGEDRDAARGASQATESVPTSSNKGSAQSRAFHASNGERFNSTGRRRRRGSASALAAGHAEVVVQRPRTRRSYPAELQSEMVSL